MSPVEHKRSTGCGGSCSHCNIGEAIDNDLGGWRLVLPTMGVFLFPLILAIIGGSIFRGGAAIQTLGTFGGLFLGFILGIMMRRIIQHKETEK